MAATPAPAQGLSTAELDQIRAGLADGRTPKVVFTAAAGQIAGQAGQVVRLEDPEKTDEWLVVRFGRDELPFSPADLAIPRRGRPPKTTAPRKTGTAAPAVPAPREAEMPARRPAKRATASKRTAKPKPPASLTVTLAYQDGEWTVGAQQGSKTVAKPYLVRPSDALKMVSLLDVPGVHDAVEQIVTAELTEAQRRADALRSELAEVEARLAELRDAGE
jgi:hypothetical protein